MQASAYRYCVVFLVLSSVVAGVFWIRRAQAATLVVVSSGNGPDTNPGDGLCTSPGPGGECTLRAAIMEANALLGTDTISFALGAGNPTLSPSSALPTITSPVIIDGNTGGATRVQIDGTNAGAAHGLILGAGSGGSQIKSLVIRNFATGAGLLILSNGNTVQNNYFGTDATGTVAQGNLNGLYINDAANNIIGGTAAGLRNLISGNINNGVQILGVPATSNVVQGNFIGTNITGTADLGNNFSGVFVSAPSNTIGGTASGAGNLVSGNNQMGVSISGAAGGNVVQGNLIGTTAAGTAVLGNSQSGVEINLSPNNTIGGSSVAARNIISGNSKGVIISGNSASGNVIAGNYVGIDLNGNTALGNTSFGVHIDNAPNNRIGGTTAAERNVISGNLDIGLVIAGPTATGNQIQGNFIGTNASGTAALKNNSDGVLVSTSASGNTIGGSIAGAGNVISGNDSNGVRMNTTTTGQNIQGNFIGTDVSGTADLGNRLSGILISQTANNIIGGTSSGARNLISGNNQQGIEISGSQAIGNQIQGNFIGINVNGTAALGNRNGVLTSTAVNNTIGGTTVAARNVISGNIENGVFILGGSGNQVLGNLIGTNPAGTAALGNTGDGVRFLDSFNNRIGGSASGEGNVIGFNGGRGVNVTFSSGGNSTGNLISRNAIGSNGSIGIDLNNNGVTPNDVLDPDTGPNNLQNFPVIASAVNNPSNNSLTIQGSLNSTANTNFTIEFFSSAAQDPSGFGEGESFRGSTNVTTDAGGNANFSVVLPTSIPLGHFVTATATNPNNNTSEFSQALQAATATPTVQFSSGVYAANEADNFATITVTRMGNTSGASTVDYAVTSSIGYAPCNTITGQAAQNCDYTFSSGTLRFAANETSKDFVVIIANDVYAEGNELLTLGLSNPVNATVSSPGTTTLTILDNDSGIPATNPIDDASFFVRQHYSDFLSRLPDQGGLDYWTSQITSCGSDQGCIHSRRVRVSDAFFYEQEFQRTAAYVFRLYRAAYGNDQPNPNPDSSNIVEAKKIPSYYVFILDRSRVVDGPDLGLQQLALASAMVQRPEFLSRYSAGLTGPQFVDALLATIQGGSDVNLTSQRDALITLFNQGGRGAVLYRLADDNEQTNPINNRAFIDAEYNRSFIYGEYAGYLRRDADIGGFLFWLGQINRFPLRDQFIQHAMVCSFITSREFQERFSPVVTRTNAACDQ